MSLLEQPLFHKLLSYIDKLEMPAGFAPTGQSKDVYLDLMERSVAGYGLEDADRNWGTDGKGRPLDMQVYCRIACVLAGLMAAGRRRELQPLWEHMMDTACAVLPTMSGNQMADFSTKELLLAYKAMRRHIEPQRLKRWALLLSGLDPSLTYVYTRASVPDPGKLHNINLYNMAGEYLRETEGMTDAGAYLNAHWPLQLPRFDENGMYCDPGCPLTYDLAARCHIQLMFAFGYKGPFHEELNGRLEAGGMMTLFMQSAAGHAPYGGRSSQFQFNEALAAACAEFEAARHTRLGNRKLAGAFKRSARLSAMSLKRWVMEMEPPRHVKNRYPVTSGYGAETYAYYDKYMVTLGSFAYMAYLFAWELIDEWPCPAETGGYVLKTSPSFHMVFAAAEGQSIQLDLSADRAYDSTGLGRYHRQGISAELALSSPLCAAPAYALPEGVSSAAAAIGPGWERPGGTVSYLARQGTGLKHNLSVIREDRSGVQFSIAYSGGELPEGFVLRETYVLSKEGLEICTAFQKDAGGMESALAIPPESLRYQVPLFCYNGEEESTILVQRSGTDEEEGELAITVALGSHRYELQAEGSLELEEERFGNRNGEYRLACIRPPGLSARLRFKVWTERKYADEEDG